MSDKVGIESIGTTVVTQTTPPALAVSRRGVLLGSFFGALGVLVAGSVGTVVNVLYPRRVGGFGGPIVVPSTSVPEPGGPPKPFVEGRFLLVNLLPGEGNGIDNTSDTGGGLVALYRKCPHLGCTVPWVPAATIAEDARQGWFVCPCHASTYTKAGIRVKGPAPRSMDTMAVEVLPTGDVIVDTGSITQGGLDNPRRAAAYDRAFS